MRNINTKLHAMPTGQTDGYSHLNISSVHPIIIFSIMNIRLNISTSPGWLPMVTGSNLGRGPTMLTGVPFSLGLLVKYRESALKQATIDSSYILPNF